MVFGAILAAGASLRLGGGQAKQLVVVEGEPLVRRTARRILASSCARVAVVVGARAGEVGAALADLDVTLLANDAWAEGMASSIHAAVAWARAGSASGLLLAVVDQVLLDTAHVNKLLAAFDPVRPSPKKVRIVASAYDGIVGVPAVFGSPMFTSLAALTGDQGARSILRGRYDVRVVPWPAGTVDVDTAADLAALPKVKDP